MAELIDIDGLIIDSDTGEIIEAPPGHDGLAWAAWRLYECQQQIKAWEQTKAYLKHVLVTQQDSKKAIYGDVMADRRQQKRKELNLDLFRQRLDRAELRLPTWRQLALAATGYEAKRVPIEVEIDLAAATEETLTAPYVVVSLVRKAAPVISQSEKEREDDDA